MSIGLSDCPCVLVYALMHACVRMIVVLIQSQTIPRTTELLIRWEYFREIVKLDYISNEHVVIHTHARAYTLANKFRMLWKIGWLNGSISMFSLTLFHSHLQFVCHHLLIVCIARAASRMHQNAMPCKSYLMYTNRRIYICINK